MNLECIEKRYNKSTYFYKFVTMNKILFGVIAKLNKVILPSFTKQKLDLGNASKIQLLIFGWKLFITKRALN